MPTTEKYISCTDCQVEWIDHCYVCRTDAWRIRKLKSVRSPRLNGFKKKNDFHISKRAAGLVNQGHKKECVCCGSIERLTFDHVTPLAKGGIDDNSNGQILCGRCNWAKGSRILTIKDLRLIVGIYTSK